MPPKCHQRFLAFEDQTSLLEQPAIFSTSTERGEKVKCQTPNNAQPRAPTLILAPCSSLLPPPSSLLAPHSSVVRRRLLCGPALTVPSLPTSLRDAALHPSPDACPSPGNPATRCLPDWTTTPAWRERGDRPCNPASNGEQRKSARGAVSSGTTNNVKTGAVVFQILFLPRAHLPLSQRVPSLLGPFQS